MIIASLSQAIRSKIFSNFIIKAFLQVDHHVGRVDKLIDMKIKTFGIDNMMFLLLLSFGRNMLNTYIITIYYFITDQKIADGFKQGHLIYIVTTIFIFHYEHMKQQLFSFTGYQINIRERIVLQFIHACVIVSFSKFMSWTQQDKMQQLIKQQKLKAIRIRETQKELLKLSGFQQENEIQVQDVYLDDKNQVYLHTLIIDNKDRINKDETLVILHGLGGSGTLFYRTYKDLSKQYKLIFVDLIGMGQSTRISSQTKLTLSTTEESESYFIEPLEKWRQKMNLQGFTLIGHSLGGYIATCYALKYQKYVKKLILLSPAAFNKVPQNFDKFQHARTYDSFIMQKLALVIANQWERGKSPLDLLRFFGNFLCGVILNQYFSKRLNNIPIDHRPLLKRYQSQLIFQQSEGEQAMFQIIGIGGYAKQSLLDRIHLLKIPITFMFGDKDWMDKKGVEEIMQKQLIKQQVKLVIIEKAGHQLHLENPQVLVKSIINDLKSK